MSTSYKWAAFVAIAGVLLATTINKSDRSELGTRPEQIYLPLQSERVDTTDDEAPSTVKSRTRRLAAVDFPYESSVQEQGPFVDDHSLDPEVSAFKWMDFVFESVRNASLAEYHETRIKAENGDAAAAYWLYEYFHICDYYPRVDWQLDRKLSEIQLRVDAMIDNANDTNLERLTKEIDEHTQGYQLCSVLDPAFDAKSAALEWLVRAADLGHMGAQRYFHMFARDLILANSYLAFQNPELISDFKIRAENYARELLKSGSPHVYLLMAEMYYVGDVYQRDYLKSYAYARAADLFGVAGDRVYAQNRVSMADVKLSPIQTQEAERLAREIRRAQWAESSDK